MLEDRERLPKNQILSGEFSLISEQRSERSCHDLRPLHYGPGAYPLSSENDCRIRSDEYLGGTGTAKQAERDDCRRSRDLVGRECL